MAITPTRARLTVTTAPSIFRAVCLSVPARGSAALEVPDLGATSTIVDAALTGADADSTAVDSVDAVDSHNAEESDAPRLVAASAVEILSTAADAAQSVVAPAAVAVSTVAAVPTAADTGRFRP